MAKHVVALKMQADYWSLDVSPDMDSDCRDYISAAATNIENDQRRPRRQWFEFCAQEDETFLGDPGRPLACPDEDRAAPPVPAGLATHRPCLWFPAPCVVSTPQAGARSEPGFLGRHVGHSGPKTSALGSPVRGTV